MFRLGIFLVVLAVALLFLYAVRRNWIVFAGKPKLGAVCEQACGGVPGRMSVQVDRDGNVQGYVCECSADAGVGR